MSKLKKIDREFQLSDSTVNVYGFRLLTSGYLIEEFKKNPIGYNMHDRKVGVVVKWDDLRIDGDKVMGKPVINLSHPDGQRVVDEIENGFLNAASFGHFVVLERSDDPKLMLPGQTGPTITKWYNRECSLCDIPGNTNSIALFDKDGEPISLADFSKNTPPNMKQVILSAASLALLNLTADSEATIVDSAIKDLKTKADSADALKTSNDGLTAKVTALEKAAADKKVADLVDKAIADKKILPAQKDNYIKLAAGDFENVKAILDGTAPYEPLSAEAKTGNDTNALELEALVKLSANELFESSKIERLRDLSMPHFKVKYKEYTGKEFTESK